MGRPPQKLVTAMDIDIDTIETAVNTARYGSEQRQRSIKSKHS